MIAVAPEVLGSPNRDGGSGIGFVGTYSVPASPIHRRRAGIGVASTFRVGHCGPAGRAATSRTRGDVPDARRRPWPREFPPAK